MNVPISAEHHATTQRAMPHSRSNVWHATPTTTTASATHHVCERTKVQTTSGPTTCTGGRSGRRRSRCILSILSVLASNLQSAPHRLIVGIQLETLGVGFSCLFEFGGRKEGVPQSAVSLCEFGIHPTGLLCILDGLVVLTQLRVSGAPVAKVHCAVGIELDGLRVCGDGSTEILCGHGLVPTRLERLCLAQLIRAGLLAPQRLPFCSAS
ncbi:hypothetical protein IE81DRAFT_40657 [Ceraceosorus guamensis]|uniref:Uncharacterized protein n=1 Tax=Ceraceosorus guamensis TaxID=1522189 RepID=A0A316VNU5_9BASI|nr:hypothetical protein IE81DRAFT_40657 [Ceraceosorus guamensis]PWN39246.1 hypothetical protein IE81DRAFT_40657 [Ceraceosorus guamensis]